MSELLAEVQRLEAQIQRAQGDWYETETTYEHLVDLWKSRAMQAEAAVRAVNALHYPVDGMHCHKVCAHRHCIDDSGDQRRWPCPTSDAILQGVRA